jgi:hypothetical protein
VNIDRSHIIDEFRWCWESDQRGVPTPESYYWKLVFYKNIRNREPIDYYFKYKEADILEIFFVSSYLKIKIYRGFIDVMNIVRRIMEAEDLRLYKKYMANRD